MISLITQEQIEESEYLNKKVDYWSAEVNNSRFPTYPNGLVVTLSQVFRVTNVEF